MKKLLLTGVATIALAVGVFAQGSVLIDDSSLANNGFATDSTGNFYSGTMGLEVWMANLTTVPTGINLAPADGSGVLAYNVILGNANFSLQKTYPGFTATLGGANLGELDMAGVTPAGGTVILALAGWNNASTSWAAMLSSSTATTRAGVLAFTQNTVDYTIKPTPTPADLNWPTAGAGVDLVMTTVPEPGAFALAGLGAAALLIFRRRK